MSIHSSHTRPRHRLPAVIDDPIYAWVSRLPVVGVWGVALLAHAIIYVIVGLAVDYAYPAAVDILRISHAAEIVNGINVWVIFVPTVWAYYRWLPEAVINRCAEIERMGVISSVKDTSNPFVLSSELGRRLSAGWIHGLALLATAVSLVYVWFVVVPGQYITLNGQTDFWYYTWVTGLIFSIVYAAINYVMFMFVLRALVAMGTINAYFRSDHSIAKLYPRHPDKCGGMGNIGLLISRTALIIILVPIWITIVAFYTKIAHGDSQVALALIVYVVYALVVPVLLYLPLWAPHQAMVSFKNKQLMNIATKLYELSDQLSHSVQERELPQLKQKLESYNELRDVYDGIEKEIPVWPISLPTLRSFSALAGSPIIVGLLSFGTDILTNYIKTRITFTTP